jgi:hypothetical protein
MGFLLICTSGVAMPQILEGRPTRAAAIRHVLGQVRTVVTLAETSDRDESLCTKTSPNADVTDRSKWGGE